MRHRILLKLTLAFTVGCGGWVGNGRAAFSLEEGDYYTSNYNSRSIRQFSPEGELKGTLTLSSADADSLKGIVFLQGTLYAVAEFARGFNLVRIDADVNVTVPWRNVPGSVSGNLSYGKIATDGHSLYIGTGSTIYHCDPDVAGVSQIFSGNAVYDLVLLPWGNLLVASAYAIHEITPTGVLVRQLDPIGVSLSNLSGLQYDPDSGSLYVTQISSPNLMRIDYETGVVEKSISLNYANDMWLTGNGRLLVGSRSYPVSVFDKDLNFLHALGSEDQMFVTAFSRASIALAMSGARRGGRNAVFTIVNTGDRADQFQITHDRLILPKAGGGGGGGKGGPSSRIRWRLFVDGANATDAAKRGTLLSPMLAPGQSMQVRVNVETRTPPAKRKRWISTITARSLTDSSVLSTQSVMLPIAAKR